MYRKYLFIIKSLQKYSSLNPFNKKASDVASVYDRFLKTLNERYSMVPTVLLSKTYDVLSSSIQQYYN
jgi:hypothetical protein